jgi:hypothetical protein
MELLIVHRDPEVGEQLVQMVKDYTAHECDFVGSEVAALDWGRRHARCSLLLVQLEGDGLDGLGVGASLSEMFPGLQILFLPPYLASEQRLEVAHTKIFPEPIDGEGLLEAISRAESVSADAPDLFHVVDILQMCCLSGRSGAVQMVKGAKSGIAYLRNGQIVHAETAARRGKDALHELVEWQYVEFAYDRTVRPPVDTINSSWDEVLIEAVARHKQNKTSQGQRQNA